MKILSITNIFNFSGISLVMIFSAFLGYEDLAAELGIIIGCSIFFTQIFSNNSRNLLIIKYSEENYKKRILMRIVFSILIISFINLFIFFYLKNVNLISISISIIIVLQWINELYLLNLWQNKKLKNIKFYLAICIIYYLSIFTNFILGSLYYFKILNILFLSINILFLFQMFLDLRKSNIKRIKNFLIQIISKDLSNSSFYSSSSLVLSNFISRIIIFEALPIKLSGVLFACFSIGSIPGSIFNNTFGPYLVKNKIRLYSLKIFIVFFLIFLGSILLLIKKVQINTLLPSISFFTIESLSLSIIGSLFMIIGLYYRQLLLFKNFSDIKKIFNIDIFNSFIYINLVLLISLKFEHAYFPYIFLIFAIFNFIIFFYFYNYSKK